MSGTDAHAAELETHACEMTAVPRDADAVFAVARDVVAREHQVGEVGTDGHTLTFSTRTGATAGDDPRVSYRLGVEEDDDVGAFLAVECTGPAGVELDRARRRAGRSTARRLLDQVLAGLEARPPSDSEVKRFGSSRARHRFLARLTGRRPWLGAVALLVAYLVPAGLAWAIVQAYELLPRDTPSWVVPTLALVAGIGLWVALTVRLGGWFQAVSFGEEYPITFGLLPGYLLGFWRFAVQIGCLILVPFVATSIQERAELDAVSNAETRGLESYAEGVPVPRAWVPVGAGSVDQSTYADEPNATFRNTYLVPGRSTLDDVEAWLGSPRWAEGDGTRPIGALRDVVCEPDYDTCEAVVTPPEGGPAEYTVEARLDDALFSAEDRPELTQQVSFELIYEQAAG